MREREIEDHFVNLSRKYSFLERRGLIEELGDSPESHPRVVAILMAIRDADENETVCRAAVNALSSPIHKKMLAKNPEGVLDLAVQYGAQYQRIQQRRRLIGGLIIVGRYLGIALLLMIVIYAVFRYVAAERSDTGVCSSDSIAGAPSGSDHNTCMGSQVWVGIGAP